MDVQSDITELREKLDKMADVYVSYPLDALNDRAVDLADDNGKIDLDELIKAINATKESAHDDLADTFKRELKSIEDDFTTIDSELDELQELYERPEHSDFLHELAADVSELVKYGNKVQKAQYLEYLDDCEELKEYSGQSRLILSGNLELAI